MSLSTEELIAKGEQIEDLRYPLGRAVRRLRSAVEHATAALESLPDKHLPDLAMALSDAQQAITHIKQVIPAEMLAEFHEAEKAVKKS
ncbi:MAG: hypothetical protein GY906_22625 [bacterium]|nr:hypothetical protein [bacterium]